MENRRNTAERRNAAERRTAPRRNGDITRTPSWAEQRAQYMTRYLFWGLGLLYFNLGDMLSDGAWIGLGAINAFFAAYVTLVSLLLWHARRHPIAPWRWRAAMWVDLCAVSVAVLVDSAIVSPGFLVYLVVIFGNGMRYGLRFFAEAAIGSFVLVLLTIVARLPDYLSALSPSVAFFMLFGGIIVVYAYALTAGLERAKRQLEIERSVDMLTGLLNRRALYERAEDLFRDHERHRTPLVVLFADLDRFKNVNDTHGHHVGDRVLAEVARVISDAVRASDVVARFGGDEFILMLPETDLDRAGTVAERLQRVISGWSGGHAIDLSLSIGLAEAPQHGGDLKSMLEHVDQAMYQSKLRHGRGGIQRVGQALPA